MWIKLDQLLSLAGTIPSLVYIYWGLAAGAALVALAPVRQAQAFRAAVLLTASRGKTWAQRPRGARLYVTDISVPQRFFLHFYIVGVAASALVLQALLVWRLSDDIEALRRRQAASLVALAAFQAHVLRRFLESAFLLSYPAEARMHIFAYIFALSYYVMAPLSLVPPEMYDLPWHHGHLAPQVSALHAVREAASAPMIVGAAVFCFGSVLQLHSHAVLAGVVGSRHRKHGSHYFIPEGGGFCFVSCPHYLAEILIYLGLALISGPGSAAPWLMLTWVAANLLLAAQPMHHWYLREFEEYPKDRKAILPMIF